MAERTATISSAAKTFSFTGWKIGWVTGRPQMVAAVRTVKQFLTFVNGGPFQYAIAQALALPEEYYRSISADLMVKRDLMCDGLASAGFEVYRPDGTYFITTSILPFKEAATSQLTGLEFCRTLPKVAGVVAIPMQVFYDHPEAGQFQVRFAFCKRKEVLNEAIARLSVLQVG
jgi:N-succinyldiaminopimelate aminotransferase